MDGRAVSCGGSYEDRPAFLDYTDECGRCALEAQHPPEPCAYVCGSCNGTGVDCDRDDCVDGLIYDEGWDDEESDLAPATELETIRPTEVL